MAKALQRAGVPDYMPFILASDGSYDVRLNQFFRELLGDNVHSPRSWRSYSYEIVTWMRFLEEVLEKTIWEGNRSNLLSFNAARRKGESPISASTWNRCVAILDKFYSWAYKQGYIREIPFTYHEARRLIGETLVTVKSNDATERAAKKRNVRYLSMDDFIRFRDVGLRGRLPNGEIDPKFRGRNGERNAAFAELLATTGMRLTEANSLLLVELPTFPDSSRIKNVPFELAPAITKGQKGRTIRLPRRILKLINSYRDIERDRAVERARQQGTYLHLSRWTPVTAVRRRACTIRVGNRVLPARIANMDPTMRSALYTHGEMGEASEPLALWLSEQGTPLQTDTWEAIFAQASARCRLFGFNLEVTPHMLRHTFAVYMLAYLIRKQVGELFEPAEDRPRIGADPSSAGRAVYRRLGGDPLITLRDLMGHASITTTEIYLRYVPEAQKILDDALDQYATDLESVVEELALEQNGEDD